jgi:hypothetical protein
MNQDASGKKVPIGLASQGSTKNGAAVATQGHTSRQLSLERQIRRCGVQQMGRSPHGKAASALEVEHHGHIEHQQRCIANITNCD